MTKDREPKTDAEVEFRALESELISEIIYRPRKNGFANSEVSVEIVGCEWDGGSRTLVLTSSGMWNVRLTKGGYTYGRNPRIRNLIIEYAGITDPKYVEMSFSETQTTGRVERKSYIQRNEKRLRKGLMNEMQARAADLRNSQVNFQEK